jgi:hypothetical protein
VRAARERGGRGLKTHRHGSVGTLHLLETSAEPTVVSDQIHVQVHLGRTVR